MTSINPNNYISADLTLVGYAASGPRNPAYDKEGKRGVKEIPIPINEGYKDRETGEFIQTGTTWYQYVAAGDGVATIEDIRKGDKVRIDGARQSVREYTDKDGNARVGIELRFGTVTVLEQGDNHDEDTDDAPF